MKNESRYEEILPLIQFVFLYASYFIGFNVLACSYGKICSPYQITANLLFFPLLIYQSYHAIVRYLQVKQLIKNNSVDPSTYSTVKYKISNYNVALVYQQIYEICIVVGLYSAVEGFYYAINNDRNKAVIWFFIALLDVIPIIVVSVLGDKFCFSLLARFFEYNVIRQQKDGAFMAALISKCQVHPLHISSKDANEKVLWIYRNNKEECAILQKFLESNDYTNEIDRKFWIKAVIEKTQDQSYYFVRVEYQDDINLGIRYCYESKNLIFIDKSATLNTFPADCCPFNKWANYFDDYSPVEILEDVKIVRFWHPRSPPQVKESDTMLIRILEEDELKSKAGDMLEWGRANMRKLQSTNFFDPSSKTFRDDLFTTSPRELSNWTTDDEKDLLTAIRGTYEVYGSSTDKDIQEDSVYQKFLRKGVSSESVNDSVHALKIKWKKKNLFNLSESIRIKTRFDKIDYFISHSWADDATSKCSALKNFLATKNRKKKYSFWLDKVCIDQNDTTKGIEALPINIGACKKILLLMGKTYMTRLWCIW
jgi:hypothetical protein